MKRTDTKTKTLRTLALALGLATLAAACTGEPPSGDGADGSTPQPEAGAAEAPTERAAPFSVDGFDGPEAVRYDPDHDVFFVANFTGDPGERDGTGFISRVSAADGTVEELRFIVGSENAPLHSPRGMLITGDTLWAADLDGVHAFHRVTGEPLGFTDLTAFEPGFLNDVAAGPDGVVYVTDTGRSAVYRVSGGAEEMVADTALGSPNGITWDGGRSAFLLVPWEPGHPVHAWLPGGPAEALTGPTPGRLDGTEVVDGVTWIASQTDSTVARLGAEGLEPGLRVEGRPADIGVDTRRGRLLVPYVSLDRVDVVDVPAGTEGAGTATEAGGAG